MTVLSAALAVVVAGCGSDDDYRNENRPPHPINLATLISSDRVSISPRTFGAGPVVLVITNQTDTSQQVTIEPNEPGGTESGQTQTTSPINPQDTANLKLTVRPGNYIVRVQDEGIRPADVKVGPKRPSAQNELLQP